MVRRDGARGGNIGHYAQATTGSLIPQSCCLWGSRPVALWKRAVVFTARVDVYDEDASFWRTLPDPGATITNFPATCFAWGQRLALLIQDVVSGSTRLYVFDEDDRTWTIIATPDV